ncbi:MAG: peptidoglycan DD-metalloendopeptidase family protein [Syntrophales bacterium]|nr:peptidoglycan DD-metalloendopeptidase family protein [Syntrophales bacterium]MDD5641396.1 peptidoglycan DD-metalloendopeptidase family protein [Syntrophales bacterium]
MKIRASKFYGPALARALSFMSLAGCVLFANLLVLFPGYVLADSVSPTTYSTNLRSGQSVTISKIVTINAGTPSSAKVDVFFLADTTGSMGSALLNVQDGISAIIAGTSGLGDVAYGVGEYKDEGDDFIYRLNQDITTDTAAVQAGVNAWVASGGGDWDEGQLYALDQLANTTTWRTGSTRILVWFGDAPGHDPAGPSPGVTEAQATAALVAKLIKVEALDLYELNYYGQAQRIADATGGHYYTGVDVNQIVEVIKNAIISSFQTYSTVSLSTASVPGGVSVSVSPPSYTGSYDRSIDRTFNFQVTFTGVSPGSYNFAIPVLVDSGIMASEQDNINVSNLGFWLTFPLQGYTPFDAPVSAVMDNSVLERTPIQFYVPGDVIKAFNGETGEKQYGYTYLDPYGMYWPAYKNSSGTNFFPPAGGGTRPINYLNGVYLSYAGNPGYNYQVPQGHPVLATADGKLYLAVTDPVNGEGYSYYYNSYIDHQNGYYSWYLYAPLSADILAQISQNGYAQVTRGQVIGQITGDHLHFEVRFNGFNHENVVDPYKLGLWQQTIRKAPLSWLPLLLLEDAH